MSVSNNSRSHNFCIPLTDSFQGLHGIVVTADPELHAVSLHDARQVLTARVRKDLLQVVSVV